MARMKDLKDKFNTLKDKFKADRSDDQFLRLSYDTNVALNNISATKEFCAEMQRIGSYGLVTYSITDDDKKMKKKSLNTLSLLLSETASKFPETDPMKGPLNSSAVVLTTINGITKTYEKNIESQVIGQLADIEVRCIEIQELRKKLHDQRRELDNLNEKLDEQKSKKFNPDEQKAHILKDQIDELEVEFENVSDTYIQKVLLFEASNFDNAQTIHEMAIMRTEYHENCYRELKKILPEINQFIEERRTPYSYQYSLENHLKEIKRCIAYPIEKCVEALSNESHLREEGLFRVSGGKSKSNLLCSALNLMKFDQIDPCKWTPHVLADALKRYLREMPTPLLGKVKSTDWDNCFEKSRSGNKEEALWQIKTLLKSMPESYFVNLEYLIRFLNKVVQEKSYNLMSVTNLCTVFTPNLFKRDGEKVGSAGNMELSASCNFVLESLLNDTNFFFPHSNLIDFRTPEENEVQVLVTKFENKRSGRDNILYRDQSNHSPDDTDGCAGLEARSQRRRLRCLESNIFFSDGSESSQNINSSSITSNSVEYYSLESLIPQMGNNMIH